MLENGGETYRVEDTMARIAASFGIQSSHSFVTPTGILFSIEGAEPATRLVRISQRSTDLSKVALVNEISRRIGQGEMTVTEAYGQLAAASRAKPVYSVHWQVAAAAIASGCFLLMYQGRLADVPAAVVAGGTGYYVAATVGRLLSIKFFAELLASFVIGLLSFLSVRSGFGRDLDLIMIGSVMPLVPGLLITNAVRDLMAGHLVSGISKGAEALLTAFAIGAGVALVLTLN
ncbi:threonine/serine exporter family protein [Cohnella nanjingensis]|uniref:Threonine/serine exporter family protein n=2 Tax=Cohnella nanjingensis TaxID=1387779 RepID=A0A7X0RNX8_9BACL|nr:threonine/serine exporter family protein [Cohnella nanjingensis]